MKAPPRITGEKQEPQIDEPQNNEWRRTGKETARRKVHFEILRFIIRQSAVFVTVGLRVSARLENLRGGYFPLGRGRGPE